MNVTVIVIEQLDWGGSLRTLTFAPDEGPDFWVARLDEYDDPRSTPFHVLDRRHERELDQEFRRARDRQAAGYVDLGGGSGRFRTEWRGIRTKRSGLSCYALALPVDAVPRNIQFTDPHSNRREYGYRAVFDPRKRRVVCYLECRSSRGSFDFDLALGFHRDPEACAAFQEHEDGTFGPRLEDLERMAALGTRDRVIVQQFFDSSHTVTAEAGSIVVNQSVHGPIVGSVTGTVGAIGSEARGEVTVNLARVLLERPGELRSELTALVAAAGSDPDLQAELLEAVAAVDARDVARTSGALRRLGTSGLRLARDLGVNLAAALIAAHLGIS